jgi:hypothetical protein
MTMIYVDHQTLSEIAGYAPNEVAESAGYHDFLESVRQEVSGLSDNHRQVIIMYYFESREITAIAIELHLNENDVRKLLREGLGQLKHRLTDLVQKRWPDRFAALKPCPICSHPRRRQIDKLLEARKPTDSWGKVNRAVRQKFGCTFNPPSVIINHLKYHIKGAQHDR